MNTDLAQAPTPTVVQSAPAKPPPHRLGFCLSFSLFSVALFAGCGAAPESFEDEAGEDVATETAELRTADDLEDLPLEEIAMDGGDPMVQEQRTKEEQDNDRAACKSSCFGHFWDLHNTRMACDAYCDCVFPPGTDLGNWGSCAGRFLAAVK